MITTATHLRWFRQSRCLHIRSREEAARYLSRGWPSENDVHPPVGPTSLPQSLTPFSVSGVVHKGHPRTGLGITCH
ncbi:MAG: hypothetical protein QF614_07115, partial [SAR324 cluster bacterium]|nr:hypothetical protein [SAR324 cluster bacterium]